MTEIYAREPLEIVDGVPVFSPRDDYVENYERIASDHMLFQKQTGETNPFIDEDLWQQLEVNTLRFVRDSIRPGDRILDIGVGTGRLLAHFPELLRHGIDVSITYLGALRESGIDVCMGKVEDLPYVNDAFDIVTCTDVLEHVVDLHRATQEIRRVLRPGGHLIVRVPWREDLSPYLAPDYPYEMAHLRSFDEHALELLFCRILKFDFLERAFDTGFTSEQLRTALPRGRGLITRMVRHLARAWPASRRALTALYRPTEITMVFQKPIS